MQCLRHGRRSGEAPIRWDIESTCLTFARVVGPISCSPGPSIMILTRMVGISNTYLSYMCLPPVALKMFFAVAGDPDWAGATFKYHFSNRGKTY